MAPSKESQALAKLFAHFQATFPADGDPFLTRCIYDQVQTAATEAAGVSYESIIAANRPCLWIKPEGASPKHVILFMHGGGYTFGSTSGHRKIAAHLAKACNSLSISVDYRLTPEHNYPAGLNDCVDVYQWLLEQGFPASNIVTAGDSCGGALSTAVHLAAKQRGIALPAAAIALSPWYDVQLSGDSMATNANNDKLGSKDGMKVLVDRILAGGASPTDPLISPQHADLHGLPPHFISAAGYDILRDQAINFVEKAKAAGVNVTLTVSEGQQHVFEFMAGNAPESDESLQRIGRWVRDKLQF